MWDYLAQDTGCVERHIHSSEEVETTMNKRKGDSESQDRRPTIIDNLS